MPELRGLKLKTDEVHTRRDTTQIAKGYIVPVSVLGDRNARRITVQVEFWKDRATYESVLQGLSTSPPVSSFPIEISGAGFAFFATQNQAFFERFAEYLALNNPGNMENIDFSKWERESEGTGIIIPAIILLLLTIIGGMVYFSSSNPNLLFSWLP